MDWREFLPVHEYKAWVEDARDKLEEAKKDLDDFPFSAFQRAHESAEFLLKAVLVRAGKFGRKNRIHQLPPLLDKIDREKCLPPGAITKAREIVPELEIINVGGPRPAPTHVDSITYTAEVEYPKAGMSSTDRISKEMAEEKICLSQQLLELLLPYLDC
ncbi:MAG: HEPN domain-containing protein [Candidatus Hodarchaeaceae archaeon]|nr:HEPN domain-containing protein [Candidatus Hodarchaeaceae archaeon]